MNTLDTGHEDSSHAGHRPGGLRGAWWMLLLDAALIILFAALGNRTHLSGLGLVDILSTASPFLLAWALSAAALRTWHRPSRLWPDGVIILIATVTLGMALRVVLGLGGAPVSFVLVTAGVLTTFLLGRRLLTGLLVSRSRG
ncbi:DUF3054 domain-containing protein [Nesterenkonia xinjiangensis]|uniref:DUF3054 family protein n=1 Tax=Nesterenkonia xinjiangensis TaxID=225327 RepID=A0A7Z0GP84_9MICC|nr:DUF3054 domain-containing protein [Nesterenkonia xinjiangensis]NYJ79544.1 hypothetical protein [Nesterenkonia xinjiangensis]